MWKYSYVRRILGNSGLSRNKAHVIIWNKNLLEAEMVQNFMWEKLLAEKKLIDYQC